MKNFNRLLLTSFLVAYNNSPLWKTDENGALVLKDGNPVYLDTSGAEKTVGLDTITRLNGEAKTHREAKEAAEARLKAYEGLDPEKARAALETVSKIDDKKLLDAGKVDELRAEMTRQFQTQIGEKDKALGDLQSKLDGMVVNNVFANSEFIRNSVAVPRDMFEATFRNNFKVENGQVAVYGTDGNRLYSKEKAGEFATPEEGLKILAEGHAQKDIILKANAGNGTGSEGNGGNSGQGRVIKRSELMSKPPAEQAALSKKIAAGEMKLTD